MKIAVVGMGKIGLPLAVQYAKKGNSVTGIDINSKTVELTTPPASNAVAVPGAEIVRACTRALAVTVSPDAQVENARFTVTFFVSPARTGAIVADAIEVASTGAAEAGTVESRPNPIADTATSAMRLRSVFVDICFLSISRSREFPPVGFG